MKRTLTWCLMALCAGLFSVARAGDRTVTVMAAAEHDFKPVPGRPGFQSAPLWGDRTQGPWGGLGKSEAGRQEAWHTHSNTLHVVVISGTFTVSAKGLAPKALGPGSHAEIPAGVRHRASCGGDSDCVILVTQQGKYDFLPEGSASGSTSGHADDAEDAVRMIWESP